MLKVQTLTIEISYVFDNTEDLTLAGVQEIQDYIKDEIHSGNFTVVDTRVEVYKKPE